MGCMAASERARAVQKWPWWIIFARGLANRATINDIPVGITLSAITIGGPAVFLVNDIGNAQIYASGQLVGVGESRMTKLYPVYVDLPEDFPADLVRLGLAASIRLHSEHAGIFGKVATIGQWLQTSLAYVT